ncbi:serine hydrolase domain-containing protein [Rhizorhapis suberifaciens]|uniref:CubicO group peptidase (Beta-lactamase class C family) n=1 Tax=Rhizorhapis suberifaciens TaxID=13656 RepID=A0A840HTU3_9SPHN|nr:serine hydrolase [Rhizorhapis suberifaciens]MBB4641020.1 CubicO group peptidase (beta-lactamase class C family) [Rhizorhapis suberifaciens]
MNRKKMLLASLAICGAIWLGFPRSISGQARVSYMAQGTTGVSEADLRAAVDPLFEDAVVGKTRALIVMRNGQVIAERYDEGFGPDSKLLSWSIAKSITAVLVGLMVSDGRLVLDAPAPVPAWNRPGDPRGMITLRHLLQMSSGLEHVENGDPIYDSDTVRMLFLGGASDMAGYAEGKPLAAQPGSKFQYSTASSMILSDIMTRALTTSNDPEARRQAMMQFLRGRLTEPLGLTSLTPEFDAHGTLIGGSFMHATARDYASFGEFLRHNGEANGRQILSARWVTFMRASSPLDAGYGGHMWLNKPRPEGSAEALFPDRGSQSLFACLGHQGQYILISPEQGLTIVRLGISGEEEQVALRQQLARLVELFPA